MTARQAQPETATDLAELLRERYGKTACHASSLAGFFCALGAATPAGQPISHTWILPCSRNSTGIVYARATELPGYRGS